MSTKAKRVSSFVVIAVIMIAVMALGTCDLFKVGFGDKVDLQPPVATARNLTNGTYVRGTITLSGDASDDVGVTAVSVEATNAASGETVMAYAPATLSEDGLSWSIQIDTTGFPDGETTFTSKATDAFPRSSTTTLFLYVDNTPPTAMITAPLLYGTTPAPQQSDNIDLKGEVFDVSPVTEVWVSVLKPDGTPLLAADQKAEGTNTWFARVILKDSSGGPLVEADDGTTYTYEVRAIDRAGNESTYYYHRMDISALVRSHDGATFPTMDEIGKLDQGIISSGPVSLITAAELAAEQLGTGAAPVRGDFFFRYQSLPDIKFTNLDRDGAQNENVLAIGSPITGIITPPVGFGQVLSDTIEARLYSGSSPDTSAPIRTIRDTDPLSDADFISCELIGDSISFVIDLKNADGVTDLDPGIYWAEVRAAADGTAVAVQPVEFTVDSTAPILRETLMGSTTQNRNAAFRFGGNAASSVSLSGGTILIQQAFNDPEAALVDAQTITLTTDPDPLTSAWEWESADLPTGTDGDGRYFYTITLTAPSGKTAVLERSVIYDTSGPTISVNRLDPLPDAVTNKVNGNLTFYASPVDDNGIGEARWIIAPAAATPVWADAAVLAAPYSLMVDTATYAAGSSRLWIFARDKAGNENHDDSTVFDIDQASDLPVIALTNMSVGGTAVDNLQGVGAKVSGTLLDDDMLDGSSLQIIVDDDPDTGTWTAVTGLSDATSLSFQYAFPALSQGIHEFYLEVSDLASEKEGKALATTRIGPVSFAYDTAAPTLSIEDAQGSWHNAAFTLNGTAQDSYGLDAVDISFDSGSTWTSLWSGSAVTGAQAWSYNVPASLFDGLNDGSYSYQIRATDAFDQATVGAFAFGVDTQIDDPVITSPADGAFQVSSSVTVLGTASDVAGGSQVKEVYYAVGALEPARPGVPGLTANWTGGGWSVATGNTNWSAALTGLTEGDVTIWVRSVDVAGNMSANAESISFPMDLSNPTLSLSAPAAASTFTNATFSLTGTTGDTNALASITITENGTPLAGYDNLALSGTSYGISVTGLPSGGLVEGVYEYIIAVTDAASKSTTLTRTVTVDTSSPVLTLSSPIENEQIETAGYTIRGTVDGGYKAVTSLQWSLDNATWDDITPGVNWNEVIADISGGTGEGAKTLYLRADDSLNPVTTMTRDFYYDVAAPSLTETSVGATMVYRVDDFSLSGTAGDSNALSSVRVESSTDGGASYAIIDTISISGTSSPWSYDFDVDPAGHSTDGDYLFRITAFDAAGRTAVLSRNVRIDTTNPSVSISEPTATWYQGNSLTANGTAADAFPLSSVEYRLNGGGWATATGTNSWFSSIDLDTDGAGTDTGLAEGSNLIEVRSTDAAGNVSATASVTFVNDQNPPTTSLSAPSSASAAFALTGTAADSNALASILITESRDGGAASTVYSDTLTGTSDAWTTGAGSLPVGGNLGLSGSYVYTITITDAAGRPYSFNHTVTWDVEAPTLAISQPGSGDTAFGANLVLSGTASDVGAAGVALVEYSLDAGATWPDASGTTSWTASVDLDTDGAGADGGMSEGSKNLLVRATDNAGNMMGTPESVTFMVDQANPTLSAISLPSGANYGNALFTLTGTAADTNALAFITITQSYNGGAAAALAGFDNQAISGTSYAISAANLPSGGLTEGLYEYVITITDAAGKTASATRSITIDVSSPSLTVTSPAVNEQIETASYTIRGTLDGGYKAATGLEWSLDNATWTAITPGVNWSSSIDVSTGGEGAKTLYLRATDGLNAYATANRAFYYDTAAPGVTETAVGGSLVYRTTDFNLSGAVTDSNALSNVRIEESTDGGTSYSILGNDAVSGTSDTWSWAITVDESGHTTDGSYLYRITATDAANRNTVLTRSVRIDTTNPTATISAPTATWYQGGSLTASGTAADAFPLSSVQYRLDENRDGDYLDGGLENWTAATGTDSWFSSIDLDTDGAGADTGLPEGNNVLQVRSTDSAGNVSSTASVTFVNDQNPPTTSLSAPSSASAAFALTGTAADSNALASILITESRDGGAASTVYSDTLTGTSDAWTTGAGSLPVGGNLGLSGSYVYTITITDAAGRPYSFNHTVTWDVEAPTLAISQPGSGDTVFGANMVISGTASDVGAAGVGLVEYRLDANGDGDYLDGGLEDWASASGTTSWTATIDLDTDGAGTDTGMSEGDKSLQLRATDNAGNMMGTPESVSFIVDQAAPTLTETVVNTANSYENAAFSFGGNATDTNELDNLTVFQSFNGGALVEVSNQALSGTSQAWTLTGLPRDPATPANTLVQTGEFAYTIYLTDVAGKTVQVSRTVTIDNTPPVISFTDPIPSIYDAALYGSGGYRVNGTISFKGTVTDNYAMSVLQTQVGTQAAQTETNKYSFNRSIDTTAYATYGHADNGDLTVTVTATDLAGNTASVGITYTMRVDQSSDIPTLELTNLNAEFDTEPEASGNLLEYTASVIATASDDDSVDASTVQISIDGGAYGNVSTQPGADGAQVTFRHDLTALAEGTHYFRIQLSDINGTTYTSGLVYLVIDKNVPSISVSSPVNGSGQNLDFNIVGSASDSSGLDDLGGTADPDIEISSDGGATYTRVDTTGADIYSRSFSIPIDVDALTEGSYAYNLRATDIYGKVNVVQVQYVVDKTGPTMAINTPNAGQTVNGTVNLSGTGAETYGFVGVQIALDSNADGDFLDANDTDWTAATGTYSWSYSLNTALEADGTYDLYVRGLDDAGNYSSGAGIATRSFTIDQSSDRPSISLSTLSVGGSATDNLLPGSLQMSGTASDDDSVENSSIQIRIDANNDGDFADGGQEDWAAVTGQPALDANVVTWSHTFSGLSDGAYRFEMRCGDVEFAGNYASATKAYATSTVLFSIDTALPAGTVTAPAQGAFTRGSTGAVGGIVAITGTASDASGIASVQISVDGAPAVAVTGTTSWSYNYTVVADGQVSYQIIITDNYGKIFTIDRYFTVDITAPVPSYLQPASGSTVNGAMTVRGTSSETNQVSAVYLWIGADGAATPAVPSAGANALVAGNWTGAGWIALSGTFNWSQVIDTTLSADGTYDLHVRAVDSAGNVSADAIQQDVDYDQTTNLPVISLTNLNPAPTDNVFGSGGIIQGTVSDDDTVDASTIEISFDDGSTWEAVTSAGSDGVNVSFSHSLDTEAESGPTPDLVRVRAYDVGESVGAVTIAPVSTTTAAYDVAIDRGNPVLANTNFSYLNRYDATPITILPASMSGARIHNNFTYNFTATDGAGISSVQVSRNGGAYAAATSGGGNAWYYDVSVDVAGHSDDGTLTLAILATDTWGRTGTSTIALTIDTTEPALSNVLPLADAFVNGTVTISGTTFDVGTISSGTVVGGLTDVELGTGLTGSSWSTSFNAYDYDEATFATYQAGTQTWLFPITITVEDNALNRTVLTRNLYLDPNGDRPVIASLQPANGATVAGTIVLSSVVTDDDAPAYVRVWADLNDDNDYADDFAYDLNGDLDTLDPFETEGAYLQVSVTNNSWNALVNTANEFSLANMTARGVPTPTGYMRFHVIAYDNNATPVASLTEVPRIYIDETAPTLTGLNYASGALVRGNISLTGVIEDDMTMSTANMQISFNGGSSFATLAGITGPTVVGGKQHYEFTQPIDTSTYFPASSGILYVVLKVTDGTYKQSQVNLNFNVDNQYPLGHYDTIPASLTQVGGRYNFVGNDVTPDSDYQVAGYARDPGSPSAVDDVRVYFVKNISGTDYFMSPRTGGTLAVAGYAQTVRGTDVDLNFDGDIDDPGESAGSNASIPVPPETLDGGHLLYYIQVDNRIELNQFDAVVGIGDQDGFNESLKAQGGGYDEWSAFYDTTVLLDGQVTVYYLVTDTAGNRVYQSVAAQVANHPPVIGSVDIDAGGTDYTGLFKRAGSLFLRVNATDIEGIDATSYTLEVLDTQTAPNGGDDPVSVPAVGAVIQDDADNGEFTIDVSTWTDGIQYTLRMQVADTDGNIDAFDLDVWVNNNDATLPCVSINDILATTDYRAVATGHVEEAGFSLNDGTPTTAAISSVAGDRLSATFNSLIGNGTIQPGWTLTFTTGEWRTLTAWTSATGTATWATALSSVPTGNGSFQAGQADLSGTVTLRGTAWDDSTVVSVELSFNNGASWVAVNPVDLVLVGGDIIAGYDYTWSYVLNTAGIDWNGATAGTPIVGLNKPILARSDDGPNIGTLTKTGASSTKTVDIVPYISEVRRGIVGLKTNRTRFGRYSVYQGETTINLYGFNLNASTAGLYSTAAGAGTPDALTVSGVSSPYTSMTVAMGAATRSGWLGIRVSDGAATLDAINNLNDNVQAYNHLHGTDDDSTDWTDDRYFNVWDTGEYFYNSSTDYYGVAAPPQHPAMTIHPSTDRLFGAWSSYASSDVFMASASNDGALYRSRLYHTYDTAETVDIAMDYTAPTSTGRVSVAWLGNNSSDGDYSDGHLCIFPYERTTAFINGDVENDGAANLPSDAGQWTRANFTNWYYQGEGMQYDEQLFQFDKLRTARYGANVHWAYHDKQSKTVKYSHVLTSNTSEAELQTWVNIDGLDTDTDGNEENYEVTNGIARTTSAGEFLALALDEQYLPVVVYYDDVGKTLRLARSNNVAPVDETYWTRQSVFLADDPNNPAAAGAVLTSIGKHISAVVDDTGILHITFWSDDTGYLYYIKSTNDPDNGAAYTFGYSEIVDESGTAGLWADITLDRSGATDLPYISYLNSARLSTRDGLKVAYYDSVKGGWESIVVAASTTIVEKRVSIEYKRQTATAWNAAIGYASPDRFEIVYMTPQVP